MLVISLLWKPTLEFIKKLVLFYIFSLLIYKNKKKTIKYLRSSTWINKLSKCLWHNCLSYKYLCINYFNNKI